MSVFIQWYGYCTNWHGSEVVWRDPKPPGRAWPFHVGQLVGMVAPPGGFCDSRMTSCPTSCAGGVAGRAGQAGWPAPPYPLGVEPL